MSLNSHHPMTRHFQSFFVFVFLCMSASFAFGHSAAAVTFPLGGNANFDHVYWYNGSSYVDETSDAQSGGANDVPLGSVSSGDTLYLGMQSPFDTIHVEVGTWGAANFLGGLLTYEYSTGTLFLGSATFAPLSVSSNTGNTNFTAADPSGKVTLTFTPPSDWVKGKVNGVSAYWVKVKTLTNYTTAPAASFLEARAYNVKLKINEEYVGPWTSNTTNPTLISCDWLLNPGTLYGEWNAGGGVYYYALNTDGRTCTLDFSSFTNTSARTTLQGLSTTLQDLTGSPLVRGQNTKFLVWDEVGNQITDATVSTLAGLPTGNASGVYYSSFKLPQNFKVVRVGYVTEDGASGNTGLANVGFDTNIGATTVVLSGPTSSPCTGITAGATTTCAALRLNTEMTVTSGGIPVVGATVTFTQPGSGTIANDHGKTAGVQDAVGATNVSGVVKTGLSAAAYDYSVMASGYQTVTGTVTVASDILNKISVNLSPSGVPLDQAISSGQSFVGISPVSVVADNFQTATVSVIVRNSAGLSLVGKAVTVSVIQGTATISPAQVTTDASGLATFTIKSNQIGAVVVKATASGQALTTTPSMQFIAQGVCAFSSGILVKLASDGNAQTQEDSAVYYYGSDCKRHAFSNDKVYFTWYANFDAVTIVSASTLASMPLGKNVTYRPGIKMVKFTTVNKVYAVTKGGVLRWVTSEAVATSLYGSTWNKQIDDISDAFYTDYAIGMDIVNIGDYVVATELSNTPTIDANL